ncbi:hypothetical protein BpHYR1_041040 [Brachionus plicatilis]|uniref:Uncharacterized protein n=1 Tax=Brachionus plicatilis TaxID=10195 RepID=A0A3M7Q0F5_BRAPC|nr:hypothetical protein BpHYR1_041040 [Brachionus plicatilis]
MVNASYRSSTVIKEIIQSWQAYPTKSLSSHFSQQLLMTFVNYFFNSFDGGSPCKKTINFNEIEIIT